MSNFPFTAVVGQEAMQTALLVTAVDPGIGGVLVRGQRGTAKSTAVRALANLLPPLEAVVDCPYNCQPDNPTAMHSGCRSRFDQGAPLRSETRPAPFVDLPLSATEDRLVGTLHLGKTLETGERHFAPGLLAAANRGILYIDEVNLLPDHLVDLLLDVASSGTNLVEREGLRFSHPSRFVLIGSMNPEEGELRPQFLDRFGLCVSISGLNDPELRQLVVTRRLAFEDDPQTFCQQYAPQEDLMRQQVAKAKDRLPQIPLSPDIINRAVALSAAGKTQGHRAELAIVRTARALAALCDRDRITDTDLQEAARLALPHRLGDSPGATPEELTEKLQQLLAAEISPKPTAEGAPSAMAELMDDIDFPGSAAAGSMLFTYLKKKNDDRYFSADETIDLSSLEGMVRAGQQPRRGRPTVSTATERHGQQVGSRLLQAGEPLRHLDLGATLAAAAAREAGQSRTQLKIHPEDLHRQVRHQQPRRLVVFAVDISDSMGDGPEGRMAAALGAALSLTTDAYLRRDQVSLITFRDRAAQLLVPPTDSISMVRQRLQRLPVGGATPLAAGLQKALEVIRQARSRDPQLGPLLVLISDGDATIPLQPSSDPAADCLAVADRLRREQVDVLLIDTWSARGQGILPQLAERLNTRCHHLHHLQAGKVLQLINHF